MTVPRPKLPSLFLVFALIGLAVAAPGASDAQPPRPGSPEALQEQRALAIAAAMGAGDVDALLGALEKHFTPDTWASRSPDEWRSLTERMTGDFKGAEVAGINASTANTLDLEFAGSENLPPAVMSFQFEPTEPYRITTFGIQVGGPAEAGADDYPPFSLPDGTDDVGAFAILDHYLDTLAAEDMFSGVVLVAVDGKPVHTHARGLASIRFNAPITESTRFDLGSINKDFTKIAIGQLMQQGKLRLRQTVAELLPEYPNREVAKQITVQQLLSHSSGLGDMFTEKYDEKSRGHMRDLVDYLPLFVDEPLLFEPGKGRSYSNAGYLVLGMIIEKLSGMPYQDYVEQNVFRPAGMTDAGFFSRDGIEPDVADGYTHWYTPDPEAPWRSNVYMLPARGNPAGSAYATAADLVAYDNAVREHRLLEPLYTQWFFGGDAPSPGAKGGSRARVTTPIGIAGGAPGVTAALESDGRVSVIVLGNIDEPMAEAISRRIYRPLAQTLQ